MNKLAIADMRPELQLLLHCIQSERDPRKYERVREFSCSLDWQAFLVAVRSHRVEMLAAAALENAATKHESYDRGLKPESEKVPDGYDDGDHSGAVTADPEAGSTSFQKLPRTIPAGVQIALAASSERSRKRVMAMNVEIAYLDSVFRGIGIRPILLKGPVMSKQLYGRSDLRSTSDLDWLVEPGVIREVYDNFGTLGYRTVQYDFNLSPRRWRFIIENLHDFGMMHPQRRVYNEIHFSIDANRALFPGELADDMRKRAVSFQYGQVEQLVLSPEDLLLYLCFHGSKHKWYTLRWLADINEILWGAVEIDWGVFFDRTIEFGMQYSVGTAFGVLDAFWDTPYPLLPWDTDRRQEWLVRKAVEGITAEKRDLGKRGRFHGLGLVLYGALMKRGLHVLWGSIRPVMIFIDDWKLVDLPDRLFFLYVPLRPILWLYRNIMSVMRRTDRI